MDRRRALLARPHSDRFADSQEQARLASPHARRALGTRRDEVGSGRKEESIPAGRTRRGDLSDDPVRVHGQDGRQERASRLRGDMPTDLARPRFRNRSGEEPGKADSDDHPLAAHGGTQPRRPPSLRNSHSAYQNSFENRRQESSASARRRRWRMPRDARESEVIEREARRPPSSGRYRSGPCVLGLGFVVLHPSARPCVSRQRSPPRCQEPVPSDLHRRRSSSSR